MQEAPIVDRHQLGSRLRQLRVERALRLEDVAARLKVVPSTLSRIETGKAPVRAAYLTAMLDLYRVDDEAERAQLAGLARDGRGKSWLDAYRDLIPQGTFHYLGLEAAAEHVRGFAVHAVPGFAMTGSYAEAILEDTRPDLGMAELNGLVKLQLRRQRLLRQESRILDLLLDESALLRLVGSRRVMADQLEHLLSLASEPSITVRVIRLATIRPVLCPSFTLLSLPGGADSGIVCLEGIGGQVDVSKRAADVDAARTMFDALAEAALPPAASAKLIGRCAERVRDRH